MKTFLWGVCCCICMAGYGQVKEQKHKVIYKNTVVFSPFALADVDNTILLGSEHRFTEKTAVVLDAGYITSSYYVSNKHTSGFTLRPAFRMYYGKRGNSFLQAQGLYKQVTYTKEDWYGRECVADVPAYEQYGEYKYRKNVWGFNIMTGEVMPISDKMFLEIFTGFGLRWKRHDVIKQGNSCYRTNTADFLNIYQPKMTSISVPISFRLVYKLD